MLHLNGAQHMIHEMQITTSYIYVHIWFCNSLILLLSRSPRVAATAGCHVNICDHHVMLYIIMCCTVGEYSLFVCTY